VDSSAKNSVGEKSPTIPKGDIVNIYLDNAATTQIDEDVLKVMSENQVHYGNPSCLHSLGQKAKELVENARKNVADEIGATPNEIIFCASGTEANNLALIGFLEESKKNHIITSSTEHLSILSTCKYLESLNYEVTYLPVDKCGIIDLDLLKRSIQKNTALISIMYANNEIGSIQPIKEIGEIANIYDIRFHTDAVQAVGHCKINAHDLNVDMLSMSGHKIYAPKGIGALYIKSGTNMQPIVYGGGQESGLRSGTENTMGIIGIGASIGQQRSNSYANLKRKLIDGIISQIPDVKINGSIESSLGNIVNICFRDVDAISLMLLLDKNGIQVSPGAACASSKMTPSHVLTAIGLSKDDAYSSIRFSFGKYNTIDEVEYVLEVLPKLVKEIRSNPI